jgi:hypothetical protein
MDQPDETEEQPRKARPPKLSAECALPCSGVEVLVKIIKGYAVASNGGENPINYKDVASVAGVNPTVVSSNNRFLSESGILESPRYGYYIPTERAVRFAREAAWDEASAKIHLRAVAATCWYGQVALQNLSLRPTLKREELRKALAIKCGATEGDAEALASLIDFLVYTGLVSSDENGTLARGTSEETASTRSSLGQGPIEQVAKEARPAASANSPFQANTPAQAVISLTVHVHVKQFDELTPANATRLAEWLEALRSKAKNAEISVENKPD